MTANDILIRISDTVLDYLYFVRPLAIGGLLGLALAVAVFVSLSCRARKRSDASEIIVIMFWLNMFLEGLVWIWPGQLANALLATLSNPSDAYVYYFRQILLGFALVLLASWVSFTFTKRRRSAIADKLVLWRQH
jgi:hypothetical protein